MKIRENIPISTLTTMRLGGNARFVIDIENVDDIKEAYAFAEDKNLPVYVLGKGANTIGHDEGFDGVILINKLRGIEILKEEGDEILLKGMGGEVWDDFVDFACEKGYSGIEAMSAIPGTLGAAPVQNIGAYGQEAAQAIEEAEAFDSLLSEIHVIKKDDMKLEYRKSIFNSGEDAGRYFIVSVTVRLKRGELKPPFYTSLQRYVDEHNETDFSPKNIRRMIKKVRANKLPDPDVEASAGSFFKNIYLSDEEVEKAKKEGILVWREHGKNLVNSGWLIEEAGLKGKVFHGMKVSDKAALILINESAKSYADLAAARAEIIKIIEDKFSYKLEQEPVEIPER
ncbi:UDP-N-acetylmuramate dehydrogenase [Candidatus Saccharibacteria bacterium]|nr:UDP-N-acetylmuramate dehydrogenase [Candidatus Saccharibacteria bacterium]